jgi:UDP-galactopyranose mutase
MNSSRILVVGAGFSGAVASRELAVALGRKVLVIDERGHVGGNCHTERDAATGVMLHCYGPHIFHTSREDVWNYVRRFSEFGPFVNRIKASIPRGIFGLPINLLTINQFFGKRFSPEEARAFLAEIGDAGIGEPQNFEEQALKFIGRDLYQAFFYGYTRKQWGCEPRDLPASILKRLPVRFNYDDNYYADRFQGIPLEGYTRIVERILDHPDIEVKPGVSWQEGMGEEFDHVIFTGPLDRYYSYRLGRLGYRTVSWERHEAVGDFQGNAIMNYPGLEVPFTRKIEHKHFAPWENHERSVVFTEFSRETGPSDAGFYPKGLGPDLALRERYFEQARQERKISFLGRLATYRYLDMHQVIGEALDFAPRLAEAIGAGKPRPVLPFPVP